MKQLAWIDTIKACCMIGVYVLHTQSFIGGGGSWLLPAMVSPFYVNAFFVVSGYLFFRKNLDTAFTTNDFAKGLTNLLYRLVIPTILFSTLIYVPKLLFHSRALSFPQFAYDVFGGISFWFTSAMVGAQALLLTVRRLGMRRLHQFVVLSVVIAMLLPSLRMVAPPPFPWYWKAGLTAVVFMTLGGCAYAYREWIKRHLITLLACSALLYVCGIIYTGRYGNACYAAMSANFNAQGIVITLSGITLICLASYRLIPKIKFLQFIGKNSIIFYFLSGVVPAALSSLPIVRGMTSSIAILFVAAVAVGAGAGCTWIITRYLPFMTDLRLLKQ